MLNEIVRSSPPVDIEVVDSRKPDVPIHQSLFSFLRFDNRYKIEDSDSRFKNERMYNETLDHWFINIHWNSLIFIGSTCTVIAVFKSGR